MLSRAIAQVDLKSAGVPTDWLTSGASYQLSWPVTGASVAFLATNGQIAVTAASRASDLSNSYGSLQITIPVASFAINDDVYATSHRHVTVYGGYDEAQAQAGSQGLSFGREIDAVNLGGAAPTPPTPGSPLSDGGTGVPGTVASLWLASGGAHTGVADASFALGIKDNGARFLTGIVFGANALTSYSGFGFAMRLAKGHLIQWHDASDAAGPNIGSTVATAANSISMQFQDGGVTFLNAAGAAVASVQQVASAVNGVALTPSATGNAVALTAFGNDTNIGLNLTPKGSGAVWTPSTLSVGGGLSVTGNTGMGGTLSLNNSGTGALSFTAATSGAGSGAGTLSNAPAAGNPAFWLPVTINGTVRHVPAW
jgi:hypothetical protein